MLLAPFAFAAVLSLPPRDAAATEYCIWDGETRPCDDPPERYRRRRRSPAADRLPPGPGPEELRRREEQRRAAERSEMQELERRRAAEEQRRKDEDFRRDRDRSVLELKARADDGGLRGAGGEQEQGLKGLGSPEEGLKDLPRADPAPTEKKGAYVPHIREAWEHSDRPVGRTFDEQRATQKALEEAQLKRGTYRASPLGATVGAWGEKVMDGLRDMRAAVRRFLTHEALDAAKDKTQDAAQEKGKELVTDAAPGAKGLFGRAEKTAEPRGLAEKYMGGLAQKSAERVLEGQRVLAGGQDDTGGTMDKDGTRFQRDAAKKAAGQLRSK